MARCKMTLQRVRVRLLRLLPRSVPPDQVTTHKFARQGPWSRPSVSVRPDRRVDAVPQCDVVLLWRGA